MATVMRPRNEIGVDGALAASRGCLPILTADEECTVSIGAFIAERVRGRSTAGQQGGERPRLASLSYDRAWALTCPNPLGNGQC
jgi:hypothetical protein